MSTTIRTLVVAVLALLGGVLIGLTSTVTSAVTLTATVALIMGGTGLPNPAVFPRYVPNVESYYIAPNTSCQVASCQLVVVRTPEQFFPFIGTMTYDRSVAAGVIDLNTALQNQLSNHPGDSVVIFGYSQSAEIATVEKRNFVNDPTAPPTDQVSFVLIGNPDRPNGGIGERFYPLSFLGATADGATPTDTGYQTTDIAFQYDPVADFPQYPIDILADVNALIGFLDVHATYPNPFVPLPAGLPFFPTALPDGYTPQQLQAAMNDPANRQTYGDTTYITVHALMLPIVQPFVAIAALTHTSLLVVPIVDLVQPTLRTLIELGYNRNIPYGQPTQVGLIPDINRTQLAADLAADAQLGIHDAVSNFGNPTPVPLPPLTPTESPDNAPNSSPNTSPLHAAVVGTPSPTPTPSPPGPKSNVVRTSTNGTSTSGLAATATTNPKPLRTIGQDVSQVAKTVSGLTGGSQKANGPRLGK